MHTSSERNILKPSTSKSRVHAQPQAAFTLKTHASSELKSCTKGLLQDTNGQHRSWPRQPIPTSEKRTSRRMHKLWEPQRNTGRTLKSDQSSICANLRKQVPRHAKRKSQTFGSRSRSAQRRRHTGKYSQAPRAVYACRTPGFKQSNNRSWIPASKTTIRAQHVNNKVRVQVKSTSRRDNGQDTDTYRYPSQRTQEVRTR